MTLPFVYIVVPLGSVCSESRKLLWLPYCEWNQRRKQLRIGWRGNNFLVVQMH